MAMKYLYFAACFFISLSCSNALQTVNGKIKLTIGTTSGCGDTVNFISVQLAQAYPEYKEFLEVEFVPWGRTSYNNDGAMVCQFGPNDCWANRLHRCALNMLRGNQDAQVNYMICEFSSPFPSYMQGSYSCAQQAGLSLVEVDYCVTTTGRPLDDAAQEAARQPMEIINFVPTIHFNDVVDVELHNQARSRLSSLICFALADDPNNDITSCQVN